MAIYYGTCLGSMLLSYAFSYTRLYRRNKLLCGILSILPLFFLAAFRYGIGTDYFNYIEILEWTEQGIVKKEILYTLLNELVITANLDQQWIFIFCSIIFFWFLTSEIYRSSPHPVMSIFLFVTMTYYFAFFNIMRQMVSSAICLYAIRYAEKRDLKKFLLFVLIASGFHASALVFIIVYFIYTIRISPLKVLCATSIIVAAMNVIQSVVILIISHTKYARYIGSVYDTGKSGYIFIAIQFLITIAAALYYERGNPLYKALFNIQVMNMWISLFSGYVPLVERFRYTFGLPAIILIPMAIKNAHGKEKKILLNASFLILFSVYGYYVTTAGNHGVLPYQSIFD